MYWIVDFRDRSDSRHFPTIRKYFLIHWWIDYIYYCRSDSFSNWFNEVHWYVVIATWTIISEFGYKFVYLGKCSVFYDNVNVLALSETKLSDIFFIGRFKIPALWASFGRLHDQFGGRGFVFLRIDEPVKHLSSEVTRVKGINIPSWTFARKIFCFAKYL